MLILSYSASNHALDLVLMQQFLYYTFKNFWRLAKISETLIKCVTWWLLELGLDLRNVNGLSRKKMASCWMLFIVKFRSRLCSSLLAANSLGAEGGESKKLVTKSVMWGKELVIKTLIFIFFLILFSKGDGLKSEVQNRFLAMCIEMRSK